MRIRGGGLSHTREDEGISALLTLDAFAAGDVARGRAVCSRAHFVKGPAIFLAVEAWLCASTRTGAADFSKMLEFILRCSNSFDDRIEATDGS